VCGRVAPEAGALGHADLAERQFSVDVRPDLQHLTACGEHDAEALREPHDRVGVAALLLRDDLERDHARVEPIEEPGLEDGACACPELQQDRLLLLVDEEGGTGRTAPDLARVPGVLARGEALDAAQDAEPAVIDAGALRHRLGDDLPGVLRVAGARLGDRHEAVDAEPAHVLDPRHAVIAPAGLRAEDLAPEDRHGERLSCLRVDAAHARDPVDVAVPDRVAGE